MSLLVWGIKESLIAYVTGMPDGAVETSDGARPGAAGFEFPGSDDVFRGCVVFAGVNVIEISATGVTVSPVELENDPNVPVMVVVPSATVLARPVPEIVVQDSSDDSQVTDEVRSWVEPSV